MVPPAASLCCYSSLAEKLKQPSLSPFSLSVSSWQASPRAWAGPSRMKTMKGILKAFYLFALSSHTRSGEADSAGTPPLPFSLALPPHSPRCYYQGSFWNEAQGRWDWGTQYPAVAITALITVFLFFFLTFIFLFQSWNPYPCSMSVTLCGTFPCTFSAYGRSNSSHPKDSPGKVWKDYPCWLASFQKPRQHWGRGRRVQTAGSYVASVHFPGHQSLHSCTCTP